MAYISDTLSILQDTTAENENQLVDILFPVIFGGSLHNRKDSFSLKLEINTGGGDLYLLIYKSDQTLPIYTNVINSATLQEKIIDISNIVGITKYWQIRLVGLVPDFKLSSVTLDYEDRPEQQTFVRVPWVNLGPNKKRIRVWPVTIDGILNTNEISVIVYADGTALPEQIFTSDYPKTHLYQITTDVFAVDYAISIHCCDLFELYKIHEPTGVQVLPIAKRYDQVGSTELFRYGKIKSFIVRVMPFGGTSLPYKIIFQDNIEESGIITLTEGKEDTYEVNVTKTTAGQILRIELGPTEFDFHRFYVRVKAALSGKDTEQTWIELE